MRIVGRIASLALTVWIAASVSFALLRVAPGDAVSAQLEQSGASLSEIARVRGQLGLDASLIVQYRRFMMDLVRGDLGASLIDGQPTMTLIRERMGPTASLAFGAMAVSAIAGIAVGVAAAHSGLTAGIARWLTDLSLSAPIYWTGTLAIVVFAGRLRWFPATGAAGLELLILPVGALAFHAMGAIARVTQLKIQDTVGRAFILTAHGKGLPRGLVLRRHTLRHALPSVITVIALQTGFLLGGAVVTESIFVRPGIGRLLLDRTLLQDYPVVQGVIIVSALVYAALNALADGLSVLVDPRPGA